MADGESRKGKDRPYWLPFLLAVIMFGALTYLFFNPDLVDRTNYSFTTWVTIGYLVIVVMFIWLLIWKITLNTDVAPEPVVTPATEPAKKKKPKPKPPVDEDEGEEDEDEPPSPPTKPRKKRVVVAAGTAGAAADAADELPEGLRRPEDTIDEDILDLSRVVEYPAKEPGGVYSDTPMRVDEHLILNFRIILGKVCHNCEELEDCMRRVEGKLDEEAFLNNFECKEGIKQELQRARKKRESEGDKAETAKEMVQEKAAKAKEEEGEVEPTDEEAEALPDEGEEPASKEKVKKKATPKKKTGTKGAKEKTGTKGAKKKTSSTSSKKKSTADK